MGQGVIKRDHNWVSAILIIATLAKFCMQSADYLGQFIVLLPGYKKVPKQDVSLKSYK